MFDSSKSSTIYRPKTISEFDGLFVDHRDALLFAGGTHIMRYRNHYPKMPSYEIIDLMQLKQFDACHRSYDMIEVGAGAFLSELSITSANYIPDCLRQCVTCSFPYSLVKIATIGGTLIPDGTIYDMAAPLFVLRAMLDMRIREENKVISVRIPVDEMYHSDVAGKRESNAVFIERVHIPRSNSRECSFFFRDSSSFDNPSGAITIAYSATIDEDIISDGLLAICYPDKGISYMAETIYAMNDAATLYLSSSGVDAVKKVFEGEVEKIFPADPRNAAAGSLFDNVIESIQLKVL